MQEKLENVYFRHFAGVFLWPHFIQSDVTRSINITIFFGKAEPLNTVIENTPFSWSILSSNASTGSQLLTRFSNNTVF